MVAPDGLEVEGLRIRPQPQVRRRGADSRRLGRGAPMPRGRLGYTGAMPDLEQLTTPIAVDGVRFTAEIPDGWQQGRGCFGGLVVALLARAAAAVDRAGGGDAGAGADGRVGEAAGARELRALSVHLAAPVEVGPIELQVEPLRVGSGVATHAARLFQGGALRAHAVAVLGKRRVEDGDWAPPASLEPTWRSMPPLPVGPPLGPVFTQHFEFRSEGPFPFSGVSAAQLEGWIRPKQPGAARDAAYLATLADAWWPVFLTQLAAPRPIGTIAYALELVGTLDGLDPDAPLHHRAVSPAARDGYAVELRELRGEDGRLLALNQQTFAIIR